jgi:adenylate cyclase
MADREVKRRLAAILAADVAGYTRLMEEDSEGTVAAWQDAREDVIKPNVESYSGKIVKLTGDGFLVEFATVQDAVNCAIAMQSGLVSSSLDFRFGINLGDIIDDGEDIHGEGVNVAARLEGLAEPGGICISGDVYNQVRNRIEATFEDMGEQTVKNVSAPVQAYAVLSPDAEGLAKQAIILQRPAVAVLPFDNMSGDEDQEYFVDGLTEDIITALAAWRSFPVIGRNSTFTFKNRAVKAQDVAAELGARYILEGSVRKAGGRVRITAQLLDAETGHHVWAERYDEELIDVFDLQDKITQQIVAQVAPEMARAELQKSEIKPPANLDAWDYYLRGTAHLNSFTPEAGAKAQEMFHRAIELDPTYAIAHARLAVAYHRDMLLGLA